MTQVFRLNSLTKNIPLMYDPAQLPVHHLTKEEL